MDSVFDSALYGVAQDLRQVLASLTPEQKSSVFEIRLRAGQPVVLTTRTGPRYLSPGGTTYAAPPPNALTAAPVQVEESFRLLCEYSVYARDAELAQGFLHMRGGHRAGIAGEPLQREGRITAYRYVSGINIRLARQVTGIARPVLAALRDRFGQVPSCFFYGPPGCGKTTLLRDAARQLSTEGRRVSLIDCRGELAAPQRGVPAYDLGPNCDLLTGCEKPLAIRLAIRTLNPEYLLFDEIAGSQEIEAVEEAVSCGVAVLTTAHAGSFRQLRIRRVAPPGMTAAVFLPGVGLTPQIQRLEVTAHENGGDPELGFRNGGSGFSAGMVS